MKNYGKVILLIFIGVIIFILSLAPGILSFVKLGNIFEIDSASDFIYAINHSNEAEKAYKYRVMRSFDIDIDKIELPTEKSFYGDLDGNGYTITIKSNSDKRLVAPIFSSIQKGAAIRQLSVKMEITLGEDDNTSEIALLANRNFGAVEDCSFTIHNIYIGNRCQNASAIVNDNFGRLESICIKVNAVISSQTRDDWQCSFGSVATNNYAIVKNVFISTALDDFGIFDKSYNNQSVGYVFCQIGNAVAATDMEPIYLFGNSTYWDFSVDSTYMKKERTVYGERPTSAQLTEFVNFSKKNNDNNVWISSQNQLDKNTGFPVLKNSIEK